MIDPKIWTRLLFLFVLFCLHSPSKAQDVGQIRADHQTYLTGTGSGSTLKTADQNALTEIIEQISIQIESRFETIKTEKDKNLKETVKDVVTTYSNATLLNTERIILEDEPNARVFRYIKRSEVARIFESRKNKIIELALNGKHALENLQIADALRYFYWSQTLLRSHPNSAEIKANCEGQDVLLVSWLPVQINDIFLHLKFQPVGVEKNNGFDTYFLKIFYKGQPVQNLDYTYWNGQDWSNIFCSKDGLGVVELPALEDRRTIRLRAEYAFEGEANIDQELQNVMEKLPQIPYKNCYFNINTSAGLNSSFVPVETSATHRNDTIANATENLVEKPSETISALTKGLEENNLVMKQLITAIQLKDFDSIRPLFSKEGFQIFQELLQYGDAKIANSFDLKYYPAGDYVICRSIPMHFSFKTNNRTFIEEVIFYFDQNHKICNLTFGLSHKALEDIASNSSWREADRILLINFLENYKTAFSLKRYDYISNIFSDNALIITGFMTKIIPSGDSPYAKSNIVRYNRQKKSEYLKKLKYSFDSKEYINIRFTENTVRRSGKGNDIYGIQIKQDYFSTNYGDSGYLFLLVDLSDTVRPQIHVRTWQPEKNPDGTIYGLSDF